MKAILDDIIVDIPSWYDFHFEKTHVEVISGEAEGMYAWISLNYMLGRFSARHTNSGTTAAFIVIVYKFMLRFSEVQHSLANLYLPLYKE